MSIFILSYAGIGLLFGLWFLVSGHTRLDASSVDAAWYTRLMWLPGTVLLWPLLAGKLVRGEAA
ncbi:MAG: hypothetical protein AB8B57_08800 [Congregibacter sp.]